ncbi:LytR C-terminal domain-containing protein [Agromyces salentinus]|uniref:LytR/CpsA/Psr regulator C-terminal domain-containing protein n=1 Tax=Agromyces salentinus TaxID=269421 RepID=A0ABN2MTB8_9MICO|nr:LytR C-terminal domain-containing protein [Agromyces salentinus]
MAQNYPRDRFDSIPHGIERVGAHRAPQRRGARWVALGWAALATAVLTGAGIAGVVIVNDRVDFSEASPSSTPSPVATAEPTVAPDVPVTVLNGTATEGLAATAGETLTAAGIPVSAMANASESDLTETVVYYATADLEGAARGVAQAVPGTDVRLDAKFGEIGTPLVLVLGSDFAEGLGG